MANKPPYFSMPDDLPGRMLDLGLGIEHVGLNVLAWAESSRHQLDGCLARSRIQALRGWGPKRQQDLIDQAIWATEGDNIRLAGYLDNDLNRTRAAMAALREARMEAGRVGGTATAEKAPCLPDGTFAVGRCPIHDVPWKIGRYGGYCSQKASGDQPRNLRGYCTETPSQAQNTKQTSKHLLGPVSNSVSTNSADVRTDGTPDYVGVPPSDASGEDIECYRCNGVLKADEVVWIYSDEKRKPVHAAGCPVETDDLPF